MPATEGNRLCDRGVPLVLELSGRQLHWCADVFERDTWLEPLRVRGEGRALILRARSNTGRAAAAFAETFTVSPPRLDV